MSFNHLQPPVSGQLNPFHPINQGLVLHIPLNEFGGGILHDNVTRQKYAITGTPDWLGRRGQNFDSNYSIIPATTPGLPSGSTYRSMTSWVYMLNYSAVLHIVIDYGDIGAFGRRWGFWVNGTYRGLTGIGDGSLILENYGCSRFTKPPDVVPLNTPTHIAVVQRGLTTSGDYASLFINGCEVTSYTQGSLYTINPLSTDAAAIAWDITTGSGPQYGMGYQYDTNWYNRQLSPAEVKYLYEHPYGTPDNPRYIKNPELYFGAFPSSVTHAISIDDIYAPTFLSDLILDAISAGGDLNGVNLIIGLNQAGTQGPSIGGM